MPNLDKEAGMLFDELLISMERKLKSQWDNFVIQDLENEIKNIQTQKGYSDLLESQSHLLTCINQSNNELFLLKTQYEESKKSELGDSQDEIQRKTKEIENIESSLKETRLKLNTVKSKIEESVKQTRDNYDRWFITIFRAQKGNFEHQFNQLKPRELFTRLWKVHSWLALGESSYWSTSFSVKIIQKTIEDRFLNIISTSAFQKSSGAYSLNPLVDAQELTEDECRNLWFESSDIFKLSEISYKVTITPQSGYYQRFQLYAYFKGYNYCHLKNVMVLNLDELQYYQAVLERNFTGIVLLNLDAENHAQWVLMMKTNQSWHVYLPKAYETLFNERFKPCLSFVKFDVNVIDLEEYQEFNSLSINLELDELWVCFLVSRLYPALLSSKSYIDYRKDMAPHVLLELTKNSLRIYGSKFYSLAPYSLSRDPNITTVPNSYLFQGEDTVDVLELHKNLEKMYDNGSIQLQKMNSSTYYNQLTIQKTISDHQFFQCIELSERLKLTRISFDAPIQSQTYYPMGDKFIKLLDFNPTVTEVTSKDNAIVDHWISELYFASARNRFLKAHDASYDDFSKRKELWNQAGLNMRDYLQQNDFNLDFVNQVMATGADEHLRKYVQIAQMGKRGLDVLFDKVLAKYVKDWNRLYQEPAPQLYGLFDLHGWFARDRKSYIQDLTKKIHDFDTNCAPLFKKIGLILPLLMSEYEQKAVIGLLDVISTRKQHAPEEPNVIELYGVSESLLEKIPENLHVSISVPSWDRTPIKNSTMRRYRILQNRLEQNIRSDQAKRDLANIPKGLDDYQKGEFEVSFLRHIREEEKVLIWPTKDVTYPLNTGDIGIQQQLQQQVMQEYQQEVQQQAQKQVELEKEFQHHIGTYSQPEHDLITRDNIEQKMRDYWNGLSQDIRDRSGLGEDEDLSKIFNIFVGCSRKGRLIIERIEIETMKKLMRHASECRLGVDYHHWAGFRVSESKGDKAYILTYNEKVEKEDIASQQQLDINKKDPFFKVLREPLSPEVFRGDYLQFKTISDDVTAQKLCWYYLAKEDDDQARKDELNLKFSQADSRLNALILAQQIHGDTTPMPELSPINCIEVLKKWASTQHGDIHFIEALFSDWMPIQLQAFGQLFNVYGQIPQASRLSGQVLAAASTPVNLEVVQLWLALAYEVYQASPKTFDIWKNRILMARLHWSEVMEEVEIMATLSCINTLKEKNNEFYNHLFWKMIDAHGKSVGPMRLSEVWYGFKKFIQYLEDAHIKFTPEAMEQYLASEANFNASLFLKRLLYTLQDVSKGYEGEKFQVDILEHIHEIDWRESGLKMAVQEYQYRFWHPALLLSDLESLSTNQSIGHYLANFECQSIDSIDKEYLVTYTLRFIAQNLNVTKDDFEEYIRFFEHHPFSDINIYRLIMISIIMGQDSLKDIEIVGEPQITVDLKILNKNLPMDITKPLSYQLRFQDLALLSQFIKKHKLAISQFNLNVLNRVGFALHSMAIFCADNSNEIKLKKLAHLFSKDLQSSPYRYSPWIITDENDPIPYNQPWHQQLDFLLKEIDLKHTTWLPNKVEIKGLFSCASKEEAMNMLEEWCNKGCALNLETHRYRFLNTDEKLKILRDHSPKLLVAFADDNSNLLKKFLEKIVIDKRYDIEQQLKPLLQIFESIDCKRYYNELGLVLTTLNQSKIDLVYRVDVLSSWLKSFYDKEKFKRGPFPVQFLSQLVKFCGENKNTNLLNSLHQIQHQSTQFNVMQRQFSEVIKGDMPYDVQKILIQVAIQYSGDKNFFQKSKRCLEKIARCSYPLKKQYLLKMQESLESRELLLDRLAFFDQILAKKSGNRELDENFQMSVLKDNSYSNFSNPSITMILQLTINRTNCHLELQEIYGRLELWSPEEIKQLVTYYLDGPRPNWSAMCRLIKDENITQAQAFIHTFESKIMAEGKRDYSDSLSDKNNLIRILKEIKYKKQAGLSDELQKKYLNAVYYMNQYSVSHQLDILPFSEILNKIEELRKKDEFHSNVELIACLREVIVRKTGKWLNHTQVLGLIYASEQKESFLQQIRTGEGKSIISCARVAYRALHGQIVDIFSSKPELPARDIKEFSNVYKSLGIRHSLIQTNSPRDAYHENLDQGKGAIHYSTVGQMLLFISGVFWKGEKSIDLKAQNRVCYLDEADAALIKNPTECNYSDQDENSTVYNFDAWVYRITYEYYSNHQKEIEKNNAVSILQHLKPLCEYLQKAYATHAPEKSRFFQKFILPDPNYPVDEERMNVRIMELLKLLMAARSASSLKENIQFSCRPEIRSLGEGVEILTAFAKVIIDNQMIEGSTYCDNVHQVLHTLLNKEAIHKDFLPNFFIEPSSEIVVSFIPEYGIKNFYQRIEGLTGTSGGEEELAVYRNKFSIPHVIKLPPHAEIQSEYLADVYEHDFQSQVGKIVELYQQYPKHPFLISCQDDEAVERIASALKEAGVNLSEDLRDAEELHPKFIIDTNKTGRTEEEVLPFANRPGSITISSRMGRGTDIKLLNKDSWLIQVGTHPEIPRIEKQRRGRQGRNGAMGLTVNIYNNSDIQKDYHALKDKPGFNDLYEDERAHLEQKFQKHQTLKKTNKKNWKTLFENPQLQTNYLITRTVTIYKEKLKDEHQRPHRLKNLMISDLSWQLFQLLAKANSKAQQAVIRNQWKIYRRKIEQSWKGHLQQYNEDFIVDVKDILFDSSYHFPEFKNEYHQKIDTSKVSGPQEKLNAYIEFYQKYFQGWKTFLETPKDEPLGQMILTDHKKNLTALFKIFERLSRVFPHSKAQLPFEKHTLIQAGKLKSSKLVTNRKNKLSLKTHLFNKFQSLMEKPHFYYILSEDWQKILNKLLDSKKPLVLDKTPLWMEIFFDAIEDFPVPQTEQECQRLSRLFHMMQKIYLIAGIQDIDTLKLFTSDLLPLCARIDEDHLKKMVLLLTKNPKMTRRLIQESNQADLQHIVETIKIRDRSRINSFVQRWTVDFFPEEGAIHPIFNLMVQYNKFNIIPNIFPRAQFDWLSQHPGYSSDDLNQWMQLNFKLMKDLPPYVSLSYIVKQLSAPQGKYPKPALKRRISGIAEYTKTFNDFMLSRGVIVSVTDYQYPILTESYGKWVEKFEQMDSAKGMVFFAACRDLKVSDAYLLALVDKPECWNEWVDCAKEIQKLSSTRDFFDDVMTGNIASENPFSDWIRLISLCKKYSSLNTQWVELFYDFFKNLSHPDALSIVTDLEDIAEDLIKIKDAADIPLQLFKEAYSNNRKAVMRYTQYLAQGSLDSELRDTFLNAWKNNSYHEDFLVLHVQTLGWIQNSLLFKNHYQTLLNDGNVTRLLRFKDACEKMRDKNNTTFNFMIDYEKDESATIDKVIRYQELLDAVRGKETLPFEHLKKLYVDDKLCRLDELQEYIRVSKRAMQLSQNLNALKTFFTNKDNEVMTLMRYLHHGLLNFLGENFKMNCVKLFVSQTPTIHIDISSRHETLIGHLKIRFKEVFDRMTQLVGIYQKPFEDAKINLNQTNQRSLSFKKYKAFYDSCWWSTNAQRKTQAKGFFEKLENSNSVNQPDTYFANMFNLIFDTQKEMLESDRDLNTKRWFGVLNTKGYSRLYDITHGVFAEVMKAYLKAASQGLISETTHRQLQEKMYEQLFDVYIQMLCHQLPQNHSLKLGLEKLVKNSLAIGSDFKELFKRQDKIPKHLNHLYESIQLFQSVYEKNAEFKFFFK